MDWGLIILIIFLVGWGAVVYYINLKRKKSLHSTRWTPPTQTPYEKYLSEHTTDFNIRWQRGQVVRHKQELRDALKTGDHTASKVHKSMIVYGRSVVNHLWNSLKPK